LKKEDQDMIDDLEAGNLVKVRVLPHQHTTFTEFKVALTGVDREKDRFMLSFFASLFTAQKRFCLDVGKDGKGYLYSCSESSKKFSVEVAQVKEQDTNIDIDLRVGDI
jgi:hypothetical protein